MAMVSWLALKQGQMSKPLAWVGIAIGLAGILTTIPALSGLVDFFGLDGDLTAVSTDLTEPPAAASPAVPPAPSAASAASIAAAASLSAASAMCLVLA